MLPVVALFISYIPPIAFFLWFRSFRIRESYRENCILSLRNGALCTVGVILLSFGLEYLLQIIGFSDKHPILNAEFHAFIILALSEEIVKHYVTHRMVERDEEMVSWLDVIVYAALIGAGFEFVENTLNVFLLKPNEYLLHAMDVPHVLYGLVMGYFIGKSLVTKNKLYLALSFYLPIIIHGIYEFAFEPIITEHGMMASMIVAGVITVLLIGMILFVQRKRKDEQFTTPISELEQV